MSIRRPVPGLLTLLLLTSSVGCGSDSPQETGDPESPYVHSGDAGVLSSTDASKTNVAKDSTVAHTGDGGTPVDTNTCDSITITAAPNAPEVLIVLDRSGSMAGNNATGTNRWTPSSNVIKSITKQLDQIMHFGLMLFPDPSNHSLGIVCDVGKLNVPIGVGSAGAIASAIDASPPGALSATPTAATLQAALSAINAETACADSCTAPHKYVLLVTDGQPNCGSGTDLNTHQSDIDSCDNSIDALKAAGATTYVIGYQTTDTATAKIMNGFATHGGTTKQLPVEDEASLLATMTSIAGQLIPCDYKLSSVVDDPKFVRVTIDGQQIDLGDGWTLKDDKQTILLGSACEKLRDAKQHNLHITLECSEVIAI